MIEDINCFSRKQINEMLLNSNYIRNEKCTNCYAKYWGLIIHIYYNKRLI